MSGAFLIQLIEQSIIYAVCDSRATFSASVKKHIPMYLDIHYSEMHFPCKWNIFEEVPS